MCSRPSLQPLPAPSAHTPSALAAPSWGPFPAPLPPAAPGGKASTPLGACWGWSECPEVPVDDSSQFALTRAPLGPGLPGNGQFVCRDPRWPLRAEA